MDGTTPAPGHTQPPPPKRFRPTVLTEYFHGSKAAQQGQGQGQEKVPTRVLIQVVDRQTHGHKRPITTKH